MHKWGVSALSILYFFTDPGWIKELHLNGNINLNNTLKEVQVHFGGQFKLGTDGYFRWSDINLEFQPNDTVYYWITALATNKSVYLRYHSFRLVYDGTIFLKIEKQRKTYVTIPLLSSEETTNEYF